MKGLNKIVNKTKIFLIKSLLPGRKSAANTAGCGNIALAKYKNPDAKTRVTSLKKLCL